MFLLRNKKIIDTFWLRKGPYQELCNPFNFTDADKAQERLEAMEASRRKLQEQLDAQAARYAEQQKIVCQQNF